MADAKPLQLPDRDSIVWPSLPTETEIYILPNGQVVFADLPVELSSLVAELGTPQPCAVEAHHHAPHPHHSFTSEEF